MRVQTMFCSGCDRDVRVVVTGEPAMDGHAPVPDVEFVCLEIGETCTGALCPLCAQALDAKAVRRAAPGAGGGTPPGDSVIS